MSGLSRLTLRFLLRTVGLLLILGALAYQPVSTLWGEDTLSILGYGMGVATLLGVLGIRNLLAVLRAEADRAIGKVFWGMGLRALVLAVSQVPVFQYFGRETGGRTLIAAVCFYLVVLGVEIFSLQQYLREETVLNRKETSAAAPELTQETDSQPE
ncbi:MAG: hypothetical protein CBC13_06010 [Planctomycetia bacterium TMED53]|nr:MAG: hypothetical protein CBC13_06010 [Planctomycetia bacterium TMED53]